MSLLIADGITLTVEIALTSSTSGFAVWNVSVFNTAIWGPDEVWVDVSDWVRSIVTNRAFSQNLRLWTAGTATVVLSNVDGRFSPDNLMGPYVAAGVSGIIPGRPIRASISYAGITYPIFKGWIDTWDETWAQHDGPRKGDAYMTVSATDAWARFASVSGKAVTPVGAGDLFGVRLHRILDVLGFAGNRNTDTGMIPLQATDLSNDPVREIEVTVASEGGSVWIAPDGTFVARDRYSLVEDSRSINVQLFIGDGGAPNVPWSSIDIAPLSSENVINIATYTPVGGAPQTADDLASRTLFGDKADKASWVDALICQNDSDAKVLAQWTVSMNKLPQGQINSVGFKPRCNPTVLVPLLFGREVRDLVEINLSPPSSTSHTVKRRAHISGIHIGVANSDVDISFDLEPAGAYQIYSTSLFNVGLFGASDVDANGARFFF